MQWSTACRDWERRIVKGESLIPFPPLFPAQAAAAMKIFEDLRLADVAGKPRIGDVCRPFVLDFAATLFGSYDHETGRRLIQEYLLLVAKKNTKSTIAAGIMITALMRNWRDEVEFLILAPTIEIAKNSFGPAQSMIRADPELTDLLAINASTRTITHRNTKATLKIVAADDAVVGGKKAVGILVDELWLFGKKPNAASMFREAMGGLATFTEGFVIYLSTQANEPPAGVFKEKLDYFRDVRDGIILDNRSLPVLYEFPKAMLDAGADRDPANWYIPNPNLGRSVDEDFLRREFDKAQRAGEGNVSDFLAKHLNVQMGLNRRNDRWAGADFWEGAADPTLTFNELLRRSDVITAGIDGGGRDDLLGFCLVGRERGTGRWLVWVRAWAWPNVFERRKSLVEELRGYQKAGDLVVAENIGDDVRGIVEIIEKVHRAGLLGGVGVDRAGIGQIPAALKASEVSDEVIQNGQTAPMVVAVPQGYQMNGAIKTAERGLAAGTIIHAGQPMMAWCVGNAKAELKGQGLAITKQMAGTGKIDPLIAMFMAMEIMTHDPQPNVPSVYEERGIRLF